MIKTIIKRDGREVEFSIDKIANAIFKAAQSVGGSNYDRAMEIAQHVVKKLEEKGLDKPTVEQVQDVVEQVLIEQGHARTAKKYILYRAERTKVREMNTRLMKIYEGLTFDEAKKNDLKRENATSTATRHGHAQIGPRARSSSRTVYFKPRALQSPQERRYSHSRP